MARPAPSLPDPAALRARIDAGGRLAVRVTPGARAESVTLTGDAVLVKVRAPADKGAANDAVIALLARALGLAPSRVSLLRGGTSRQKLLAIEL
ncbi:DUF167 domain-containing protein [Erythrobacter tepidarius]|uniref:DUF167 domain-containing protein n=1 Tax=Erythrobacter tepidarius TaxID=60454 RepID=UPI000A370F6C|nr:DUF167 domain-containing protein [Erythrobacter tepidarius]